MGRLEQRYFSIYFFQIFTLRVKIWKNESFSTLLPQANRAGEYATT
jgi:hypothetical protein